jgi:hypothetical protein
MMFHSAARTICRRAKASRSSAAAVTPTKVTTASHTNQIRMLSSGDKQLPYDVVPKQDFGQYKEYSVIFTNRALNLMSDPFQKVMRDLNDLLKMTYNADKVAIIPGYVHTIKFDGVFVEEIQNLCLSYGSWSYSLNLTFVSTLVLPQCIRRRS